VNLKTLSCFLARAARPKAVDHLNNAPKVCQSVVTKVSERLFCWSTCGRVFRDQSVATKVPERLFWWSTCYGRLFGGQ